MNTFEASNSRIVVIQKMIGHSGGVEVLARCNSVDFDVVVDLVVVVNIDGDGAVDMADHL
jgi:hypothetical protein